MRSFGTVARKHGHRCRRQQQGLPLAGRGRFWTASKKSVDIMEELSRYNTRHFVLAVDPSGGGSSAFAVSSMVQLPTGQIIVRCLCLVLRRQRIISQPLPRPKLCQHVCQHTNESGV